MIKKILKKFFLPFFLGVYLIISFLLFDPKLFTGGDNAVYINLAQSLAEMKGYRNLNLPDEPGHTQYPPFFPLMLALVTLVFGQSFIAFKILIMLCGLGAAYVFFLIAKRVLKEHLTLALGAYVLVPVLILYNHRILSEIPYLLMTLLSIFFVLKAEEGKRYNSYLAFALAIVAFFTRTTGIALILAHVVYLFRKKRKMELTVSISGFLLFFALWLFRSSHYSTEGGYLDQFLAKNFYQPQLGTIGFGDFINRVLHNFLYYFFSVIPQSLFALVQAQWLLSLIGMVCIVLLVIGFIIKWKSPSIIDYYWIFSVIFLVIWPEIWSSERFLLPVLPLILIYIVEGLLWIKGKCHIKYLPVVAGIIFIIVNVSSLSVSAKTAVLDNIAYLHGDRYAGYTSDWRRHFEAVEWIKKNIPEDRIIMARKPEFVYLLSRHKSLIYPFTENRDKIQQAIDQCDYILLDNFYWTQTTRRFLWPVLQQSPERYEIVHQTRKPEFFILKIIK